MGTSDPGLCPEIAREQAIQRALFLYSLKRGTHMSMLTDYFIINQVATNMNDYKHEKMMVMATLHSEPQTYSFSVIREHTSIYGEQFVWLTVNSQGKEQRTLSSFYEFMLSTSQESHERQEERLSLSIRCDNDSILKNHSFTLKGNKEKLIISTQINDISLPLPTDLYLYKDKGTLLAQEKKEYPLSSGYWSTLLESLNDALTNFDFPGVTIQEVFESYQDTNQQLYREKKLLLLICQTGHLEHTEQPYFLGLVDSDDPINLNLLYHEKSSIDTNLHSYLYSYRKTVCTRSIYGI